MTRFFGNFFLLFGLVRPATAQLVYLNPPPVPRLLSGYTSYYIENYELFRFGWAWKKAVLYAAVASQSTLVMNANNWEWDYTGLLFMNEDISQRFTWSPIGTRDPNIFRMKREIRKTVFQYYDDEGVLVSSVVTNTWVPDPPHYVNAASYVHIQGSGYVSSSRHRQWYQGSLLYQIKGYPINSSVFQFQTFQGDGTGVHEWEIRLGPGVTRNFSPELLTGTFVDDWEFGYFAPWPTSAWYFELK